VNAFFVRIFLALAVATSATRVSADVPTGEPVDGIHCDAMEGSVFHIHQHVAIFDHGKPVAMPDSIGRPALGNCLYWIHTHTPDGIIHIEAPTFRSFTLGQLFDVWGQPLNATHAASAVAKKGEKIVVWVDGAKVSGNPRSMQLAQHTDITIDVGAPAKKPAPFTQWGGN
jgi:hypothetical protein